MRFFFQSQKEYSVHKLHSRLQNPKFLRWRGPHVNGKRYLNFSLWLEELHTLEEPLYKNNTKNSSQSTP